MSVRPMMRDVLRSWLYRLTCSDRMRCWVGQPLLPRGGPRRWVCERSRLIQLIAGAIEGAGFRLDQTGGAEGTDARRGERSWLG